MNNQRDMFVSVVAPQVKVRQPEAPQTQVFVQGCCPERGCDPILSSGCDFGGCGGFVTTADYNPICYYPGISGLTSPDQCIMFPGMIDPSEKCVGCDRVPTDINKFCPLNVTRPAF